MLHSIQVYLGMGVNVWVGVCNHSMVLHFQVTKTRSFHKPTYDTLRLSLLAMKEHCLSCDVRELCLPRIGCGLDHLQWDRVVTMLFELFSDTDIKMTVYYLLSWNHMATSHDHVTWWTLNLSQSVLLLLSIDNRMECTHSVVWSHTQYHGLQDYPLPSVHSTHVTVSGFFYCLLFVELHWCCFNLYFELQYNIIQIPYWMLCVYFKHVNYNWNCTLKWVE